jgi:hypothetical protein
MANYTVSEDIAVKMKLHYQQEYAQTLKKLNELKAVLNQLSDVDTGNTEMAQVQSIDSSQDEIKSTSSTKKPKRKYKKKPGRKSIWGKFILSRLRATNTPLSYDDMTSHAIAIKNLDPTEHDSTRKKIVAAAFVLRSKQGKIDTYAIKGSRTKYMGLKDWFEREGLLKDEYRTKLVTE